ncbi:hypothetical protein [Rhodococcus sp. T7]|uniref:hypothetical protein n=1 Tax=Rhodococcus sp. T7 TaxID=627444 RepID=UPI00135A43BC|nr:hypothetical protein [Rhodococcus sp. T7]KAF0957335.1 hypothetical protein MLGJGCBP_09166 [Rhodococcus sp. T7]KAF0966745.1 hypothetical protein MLGJGCBP_00119 [Rhodococcus sp. T7]
MNILSIPRIVDARLVERFIFNFRLRPDALDERLPATWLKPQVFNGWSVASFCVLALDRITVWPIPPFADIKNIKTISCAYRCGAVDISKPTANPTVYITDRNADNSAISYLAPMILKDTIPLVKADIAQSDGTTEISISHPDGQRLFSALVRTAPDPSALDSEVFDSLEAFVAFIKGGVSSWTPSVQEGALARVDLAKEDATYEVREADVDFNALESLWRDADLKLDSVVRATGGRYRWTYRGLARSDRLVQSSPPSDRGRAKA